MSAIDRALQLDLPLDHAGVDRQLNPRLQQFEYKGRNAGFGERLRMCFGGLLESLVDHAAGANVLDDLGKGRCRHAAPQFEKQFVSQCQALHLVLRRGGAFLAGFQLDQRIRD
ncbi:MAG: hypothetical protein ACLGHY_09915, partial [Gammaproteobacteria bacterium]